MDADLDRVFKALADPGRRMLLDRLFAENGQTLGQLRERMEMTRPVPIHEMAERWIGKYERGRLRDLADLEKEPEGEDDG